MPEDAYQEVSSSLLLGRRHGVDIRERVSSSAGGANALRAMGWRLALGVVAIGLGKGAAAGLRGRRGAAPLVGGLLVVWPAVAPWLLVWLALLTGSGYVGLATACASMALLPAAWLVSGTSRPATLIFAVCASALLLFTHRDNLARLRASNECRFVRVHVWRWEKPR